MTEAHQQTACYIHHDRPAGVVCQRCSRPICPWCMNQASVGFHCPECLKAGSQTVRQGKAAFAPTAKDQFVSYIIIAANVAAFFLSSDPGRSFGLKRSVATDFGISGLPIAELGEWWRVFTGAFLHSGIIHIGFNMYLVYAIGSMLERTVGWWRFAMIYFVTLLAGSFGVLLVSPNSLTVGASGAGFGLFGVLAVAQRANGINLMQSGLGPVLLINLLITFGVPNVSVGGHIGGLIGGVVVGLLLWETPSRVGNRWVGDVATVVFGVVMFLGSLMAATTWSSPLF